MLNDKETPLFIYNLFGCSVLLFAHISFLDFLELRVLKVWTYNSISTLSLIKATKVRVKAVQTMLEVDGGLVAELPQSRLYIALLQILQDACYWGVMSCEMTWDDISTRHAKFAIVHCAIHSRDWRMYYPRRTYHAWYIILVIKSKIVMFYMNPQLSAWSSPSYI